MKESLIMTKTTTDALSFRDKLGTRKRCLGLVNGKCDVKTLTMNAGYVRDKYIL